MTRRPSDITQAEREKIVAAALRFGEMIITQPPPARHHTLLHAFHNYNRKTMVSPSQQGFITNTGRYVGREEGMQIAVAAGQIEAGKYSKDTLYSEDLW